MSNGNSRLNGNGKTAILHIIISVLMVLVTVFATSSYQTSKAEKLFMRKSEGESICKQLDRLAEQNAGEHREIRETLKEILMALPASK